MRSATHLDHRPRTTRREIVPAGERRARSSNWPSTSPSSTTPGTSSRGPRQLGRPIPGRPGVETVVTVDDRAARRAGPGEHRFGPSTARRHLRATGRRPAAVRPRRPRLAPRRASAVDRVPARRARRRGDRATCSSASSLARPIRRARGMPPSSRCVLTASSIVAEPDFGVAILNDGRYGHGVFDGAVRVSLARAAKYPDPTADHGHHAVTLALRPHGSGLAEVRDAAARLNGSFARDRRPAPAARPTIDADRCSAVGPRPRSCGSQVAASRSTPSSSPTMAAAT